METYKPMCHIRHWRSLESAKQVSPDLNHWFLLEKGSLKQRNAMSVAKSSINWRARIHTASRRERTVLLIIQMEVLTMSLTNQTHPKILIWKNVADNFFSH